MSPPCWRSVDECMSVASDKGIWRTGVESVSAMCRNWVNTNVTSPDEAGLQARLFGILFSVPVLSTLHIGLNLNGLSGHGSAVPMLALGFAVPVVAAALLSISGARKTRNLVIALIAPVAFLATTGGRVGLAPLFYLFMAISLFEAYRTPQSREAWTTSTALLCAAATVTSLWNPFGPLVTSGFAGLGAVALATVLFALSAQRSQAEAKVTTASPSFALIEDIVVSTGALVFQVSRNGFVSTVSKNALSKLDLAEDDLSAKGFCERIHLADKVKFLTWLDGVSDERACPPMCFRLRSGRTNRQGVPEWVSFDAFAKPAAEAIILTAVEGARGSENGVNTDVAAPANDAFTIVSHELRTPLTAMVGFSDMLKQEMFGPLQNDRQREYMDLVHQSGLHLLGVVNAMLDWSRIESGAMKLDSAPFAPTDAAAFAIGVVSPCAMKKKIGLDFQPTAAFETFQGDQRACRQILINLLSNALKFTPEGGMIRLVVDVEDDRLLMMIEDNGIGMTTDQQRRVGTPFYQVNGGHTRSHEGTGLGLALVKQMAKLHGGSVEISSEPGRGTKVTVALSPLKTTGAGATPTQSATDESVRIIRVFEERGNDTQRKTA